MYDKLNFTLSRIHPDLSAKAKVHPSLIRREGYEFPTQEERKGRVLTVIHAITLIKK